MAARKKGTKESAKSIIFAEKCPKGLIGQQPADQLPWFHNKPIGVADYQLVRALPEPLDISLPSIEEIEAELSRDENGR